MQACKQEMRRSEQLKSSLKNKISLSLKQTDKTQFYVFVDVILMSILC